MKSILAFFSKLIAKVYIKKTHLSHEQVSKILKLVQTGDVFLTRDKWSLGNLFIPGFWSHTAVVVDYDKDLVPIVLEATTKNSRIESLIEFLYSHDFVAVYRTNLNKPMAIQRTYRCFMGLPYDYEFSFGNKAQYCAEIVVRLFTAVNSSCKFMTETTLGTEYYAPDTYLQTGDWTKVYDSREDDAEWKKEANERKAESNQESNLVEGICK
jgi:hypothetical protein